MKGQSVKTWATLDGVFAAVGGSVNESKLKALRRYFTAAIGSAGLSRPIEDPMLLRRRLIQQLRAEAVSPGTTQALVQFYMGVIRRAAIAMLIPPPPEGPWTRTWQSVLDLAEDASGTKAAVRSLAGWATDKGIEPTNIKEGHYREWLHDLRFDENAVAATKAILHNWAIQPQPPSVASDDSRTERLRRKAANGTVALD
jgi:hypothetical protein